MTPHPLLEFALQLDALKSVERRTSLIGGARRENSAEHSWHAALMALSLAEQCAYAVDAGRAAQMLLIHDVPEISCGDTFIYAAERGDAQAREAAALTELLAPLPLAANAQLTALWHEFAANQSPDARYANAIDRMLPVLLNIANGGDVWRINKVPREKVLSVNGFIAEVLPSLWPNLKGRIDACFDAIETA